MMIQIHLFSLCYKKKQEQLYQYWLSSTNLTDKCKVTAQMILKNHDSSESEQNFYLDTPLDIRKESLSIY